jgi:hypothetical protein
MIILRRFITKRIMSKEWWQNLIIDITCNIFMIAVGLVVGYYLKAYILM